MRQDSRASPPSHPTAARVTCDPQRREGEREGDGNTTASDPLAEPPHLPSQMCPTPAAAAWPDGLICSSPPRGHVGTAAAPSSHALKIKKTPPPPSPDQGVLMLLGVCSTKKPSLSPLGEGSTAGGGGHRRPPSCSVPPAWGCWGQTD